MDLFPRQQISSNTDSAIGSTSRDTIRHGSLRNSRGSFRVPTHRLRDRSYSKGVTRTTMGHCSKELAGFGWGLYHRYILAVRKSYRQSSMVRFAELPNDDQGPILTDQVYTRQTRSSETRIFPHPCILWTIGPQVLHFYNSCIEDGLQGSSEHASETQPSAANGSTASALAVWQIYLRRSTEPFGFHRMSILPERRRYPHPRYQPVHNERLHRCSPGE